MASRPPIKLRRCVLHIGTEKTGTTSIQKFFRLNRDAFAKEGVCFPILRETHGASHFEFVARASDKICGTYIGQILGVNSLSDWEKYKLRFERNLTGNIRRTRNAETLVVSCEQLSSHLYDLTDILELKQVLLQFVNEITVVVYLRRQDRVARSLYSTKLYSGQIEPEVFPEIKTDALPYYFNYEQLLGNWTKIFGSDAVIPRLYGETRSTCSDLLADFCRISDLQLKGKHRPKDSNQSLSNAGLHFVAELNRQWPFSYGGGNDRRRTELLGWVERHLRGKGVVCCRADAEAFYEKFAKSNEYVAKKYFSREGALFDEDFSEYPVNSPEVLPRYEDAIEIFLKAWNGDKRDSFISR